MSEKHPARKRHRVQGEKVCHICGDRAIAHHFGVLACESCKGFFRRNAVRKKEAKACSFQNNCEINKQTRSFCLACRLRKCLAVGMNPELVFNTEKREELKRKVNENRKKRQEQRLSETLDGVMESPSSGSTANRAAGQCVQNHNKTDHFLSETTGEHKPLGAFWCSKIMSDCSGEHSGHTFPVRDEAKICSEIPSSSTSTSANSPQQSVSHFAAQLSVSSEKSCCVESSGCTMANKPSRFQHPSHEQLPSDPNMYWHLSQEDRCLLAHLSSLYQETVLSVVKETSMGKFVGIQEITYNDYLGDIDDCLLSIIKFAKNVEDFASLCTHDQIAVIKSSTACTANIRAAALYVVEKDAWVTKLGLATSKLLCDLLPNFPLHLQKKFSDICCMLKHIVKNDNIIWSLLHCIMLFDPNDERIIKRQLVNSFRDKYLLLLKHYLESVYSYMHSDHYMTALLAQLQEQRVLSLSQKSCIKLIIPIPTPLVAEMIDHLMD